VKVTGGSAAEAVAELWPIAAEVQIQERKMEKDLKKKRTTDLREGCSCRFRKKRSHIETQLLPIWWPSFESLASG
jgi:hypothetical protein